jgi:hypothetical protein
MDAPDPVRASQVSYGAGYAQDAVEASGRQSHCRCGVGQ